jgi:LysR family glycine cleavage system transcriptional activator
MRSSDYRLFGLAPVATGGDYGLVAMKRKLPSLHLLHIFDAAGRHESFKLAAEELHVTPSAVSHQIKALEEQLGFALFRRGNRKLELTDGGRAYLAVVTKAFAQLRRGTERVQRDLNLGSFRINMITALGRHVVIPRLRSFEERVPGMKLHIETSEKLVDFKTQDVDLAVRYGTGEWPGLVSEKLLDLTSTPVCAPDFAAAEKISTVDDLRNKRLIQIAFFPKAWSLWFRLAGLGDLDAQQELWFDSYEACIHAAEQGLGLALALLPPEQTLIDSGRLVAPIARRIPLPQKLYMVYRPADAQRREIKVFRDWLLEQFEPDTDA